MSTSLGKRIISLLLCVLMLIMMIPSVAFAAEQLKLRVDTVEVPITQTTVEVPIIIDANAGVITGHITVNYDKTAFSLVGYSGENDIIPAYVGESLATPNTSGSYTIAWNNTTATSNIT